MGVAREIRDRYQVREWAWPRVNKTGWREDGANVEMVRDEWDWRGQVRTWACLGINWWAWLWT